MTPSASGGSSESFLDNSSPKGSENLTLLDFFVVDDVADGNSVISNDPEIGRKSKLGQGLARTVDDVIGTLPLSAERREGVRRDHRFVRERVGASSRPERLRCLVSYAV